MKNKDSRIILEKDLSDFLYNKNKSNLNISFNRIAFVFFIFFFISVIYTIHLVHLGARESNNQNIGNDKETFNNLYRADITDRNGNYIVKTVSSIDVGISTKSSDKCAKQERQREPLSCKFGNLSGQSKNSCSDHNTGAHGYGAKERDTVFLVFCLMIHSCLTFGVFGTRCRLLLAARVYNE